MKRQDIIDRIKTIVREKRTNGTLDLIPYDLPDYSYNRSLYIRNGKLFFVQSGNDNGNSWAYTIPERKLYKYNLAAFLYEIGSDDDRKKVREDMDLQSYAYISKKLGLFKC